MPRRRRRRGYPLAILIGLENKKAFFWNVFSNSIKSGSVIVWKNNEYNFFEGLIDELRPQIKQGVKTVLLVSESNKKHEGFMGHIRKHQGWMLKGYELNRVSFQFIEGSAKDIDSVTELVNESGFKASVRRGADEDLNVVMSVFEKRVSSREGIEELWFSLNEVEDAVFAGMEAEYLIITQEFQERHRRRTQRLLQIAENKGVKTKIIPHGSKHVARISQFGGLILLLKIT